MLKITPPQWLFPFIWNLSFLHTILESSMAEKKEENKSLLNKRV